MDDNNSTSASQSLKDIPQAPTTSSSSSFNGDAAAGNAATINMDTANHISNHVNNNNSKSPTKIHLSSPTHEDTSLVLNVVELSSTATAAAEEANTTITTPVEKMTSSSTTISTVAVATKTPNSKSTSSKSSPTPASSSKKMPSFLLKTSSNGKATYISMVHEAIAELNNRTTGSSVPAIQKYMKSKYEHLQNIKPKAFNANVYTAIKIGVKEERFIKIRNSYKINTAWMNKQKAAFKAKENQKKLAEKKRKKEVEKKKEEREKKKKEEKEKEEKKRKEEEEAMAKAAKIAAMSDEDKAALAEKKRQREEAERLKAEAEEEARLLAERIKKRKFPMDDLALIAEDKELGVKRPTDIAKQPFLPYTLSSLLPPDDRPPTKKTTSSSIINACSAIMSPGVRTTISDVLQVYHFFRGDVGYSKMFPSIIPQFTLKHLLYAVNEVVIGNSKKSQLVPPLLSYLFYISLHILTHPGANEWTTESEDKDDIKKWAALKQDLIKLGNSLDEASWGQTLMSYFDLMERFYSSDATQDDSTLRGYPITLVDDDELGDEKMKEADNADQSFEENDEISMSGGEVIDGYDGYLGPSDGATNKGFVKLLKYDPWYLTGEEMISMLRVLTDDIMAMKSQMSAEFEKRDEESKELLNSRKAAESNFRKVRLAFEGPKWPSKAKGKKTADEETDGNTGMNDNEKENNSEKKFKPTVSKKEFEAAEKARIKAYEQYEKGLKKLSIRTEPFGYDRNYSAYYHFHQEPDMIHVEVNKSGTDDLNPSKSWHCIDYKPVFDNFVNSLDVRGVRESALHDFMVNSGSSGLKRYLNDKNRKNALLAARKREEEDFEKRLNRALIASAEQGRRSGRLASVAKDEVTKIQQEMEVAKLVFEQQWEIENSGPDYKRLTGIDVLSEFEHSQDGVTRFNAFCGDETVATFIATKMLELEQYCDQLDPWERNDITREAWRSNVQDVCDSFDVNIVMGPKSKTTSDEISTPSKKPRKSLESTSSSPRSSISTSSSSVTQVLFALKNPLVELENRIYSITGLERAVHEADDANDNMSTGSTDSNEKTEDQKADEKLEKYHLAWKKKVHSLYNIPTKKASLIREVIISAIAIARKGKLEEVLQDLRSALHLHRPGAGGRARQTALSLLEKYGGFEAMDDSDEYLDGEDDIIDSDNEKDEDDSSKYDSYLCTEAMMITGCLEGDSNADRVDWREAVMGCKTLSRFSALVAALSFQATPKLQKLVEDMHTLNKAIKYWESGTKTRKGKTQKKSTDRYNSATDIWTSTMVTDDFVQGKVDGYPWWPARICVAKDSDVKESLESLGRVLISFVGEPHLHVVKRKDEIRPLKGIDQEDETKGEYPTDVIKNLQQSIVMAKRILRGKTTSNNSNGNKEFIEEKKTSS